MILGARPANTHKASRGGTRRAREHNGKKYNKLQTRWKMEKRNFT